MQRLWLALAVWSVALGPLFAWEKRESFDSYPAGSDAAPAWDTGSMNWEVQEKRFVANDVSKTFAFPSDAPIGRRVAVEATVILDAAVGKDWKTAGVVIAASLQNHWHLALVESPDKSHGVELVESLDGHWLAQIADNTRLTANESSGHDFKWEYNHPYRLRIELTPDGIRGTVRELDGTERAKLAYRFDNRAVTTGRPGLDNGGFRASFADVVAQVDDLVPVAPEAKLKFPPCTVAGDKAHRAKSTGFFCVAEQGGRWWLFTPRGERFYAVGTDHVSYNAHWCEKLGYAPYHRVVEKLYGGEAAWGQEALRRLQAWGFNILPTGHTASLRQRGLAHIEFLGLGAGFASLHTIVPKENWTGFPNVFHPKFAVYCDREARRRCATQRDNPWLLGYFIDNELQWFGQSWNSTLRDSALKLSADDPARKIAETTTAAEFDRLVAEKYFAVASAAIRKYDPNHLVLGCRFAGNAPTNVWPVAGKYCDVVSLNIYPRVDLDTGDTRETESFLRDVQQRTRKPMMITEWGFPALDAVDSTGKPLPSKHGAGMRVDTQEQKARCCELLQTLLFRLPFIVGSDYFMWADEPALGISTGFPEDSNYGLVSESDKPYEPVVNAFTAVNRQVYQIHAGAVPTISSREASATAQVSLPAGTVQVERGGERLVVDNGVLRLVKDQPDGNAWNRVELGGTLLGRFTPNIHQRTPQDIWTTPSRVAEITVTNEPTRVVVEMTFEHPTYRTAYRFTIYPGQNWFLSQFLWLENTGAQPWHFVSYYHYAPSKRGDTIGSPDVPDYYLPVAAWRDQATGKQYGVVARNGRDFHCSFWQDEYGQHPDAWRDVDRNLAPGARFADPQPAIVVFGAPADERPAALVKRLRTIIP